MNTQVLSEPVVINHGAMRLLGCCDAGPAMAAARCNHPAHLLRSRIRSDQEGLGLEHTLLSVLG